MRRVGERERMRPRVVAVRSRARMSVAAPDIAPAGGALSTDLSEPDPGADPSAVSLDLASGLAHSASLRGVCSVSREVPMLEPEMPTPTMQRRRYRPPGGERVLPWPGGAEEQGQLALADERRLYV